eukprot:gnl/TRDRNA2_/TRDRNA2_163824_c1_seq1.p1 gnl/TRDRNA2_/TRDRNA2_163824_c1~~gnl/TRDRNA2_/TRDRNA2_163824_c1_seq1.p1  ORF type:complete len:223 (+),score=26.99 gnl/TRDRNA2_/TRDRNA2_163824_c1_seq1:1-669(+)
MCEYFFSFWLAFKMVISLDSGPLCLTPLRLWVLVEMIRKLIFSCDCMPMWGSLAERLPQGCKPVPLGLLLAGTWLTIGIHILKVTTACRGSALETAMAQYIVSLLSLGLVVAPVVLVATEVLPRFGFDIPEILSLGHVPAAPAGTVARLRLVPFVEENFRKEDGSLEECCICCDTFDAELAIRETPCKHLFHEECLQKWVEGHRRSCPLCRANILQQLDAEV